MPRDYDWLDTVDAAIDAAPRMSDFQQSVGNAVGAETAPDFAKRAGEAAVADVYGAQRFPTRAAIALVGGVDRLVKGGRDVASSIAEAGGSAPLFPEYAAQFEAQRRGPASQAGGIAGFVGQAPMYALAGEGLVAQALSGAVLSGLQAPEGERIAEGLRAGRDAMLVGGALKGALGFGAVGGKTARAMMAAPEERMNITRADQLANAGITGAPEAFEVGSIPEGPATMLGPRYNLVRRMDDLGFELSKGQRWNNPGFRQTEARLKSQPETSQAFFDTDAANGRVYARIVNRALGFTNAQDYVNPETLGVARANIAGRLNASADEINALLPELNDPSSTLAATFDQRLSGAADKEMADIFRMKNRDGLIDPNLIVGPAISNINELAGRGELDAKQLMAIRSSMVDRMQRARRGDVVSGTQVQSMGEVVGAIDDLFAGAAREGGNPGAAEAYATARSQFRVLAALEDSGASGELGNVSAAKLYTRLRKEYPMEFRRGGLTGKNPGASVQIQALSDLFDATRGGQAILPDIVGNSGSATRMGNLVPRTGGPIERITDAVMTRTAAGRYNFIPATPAGWTPGRKAEPAQYWLKRIMERAATQAGVQGLPGELGLPGSGPVLDE